METDSSQRRLGNGVVVNGHKLAYGKLIKYKEFCFFFLTTKVVKHCSCKPTEVVKSLSLMFKTGMGKSLSSLTSLKLP